MHHASGAAMTDVPRIMTRKLTGCSGSPSKVRAVTEMAMAAATAMKVTTTVRFTTAFGKTFERGKEWIIGAGYVCPDTPGWPNAATSGCASPSRPAGRTEQRLCEQSVASALPGAETVTSVGERPDRVVKQPEEVLHGACSAAYA